MRAMKTRSPVICHLTTIWILHRHNTDMGIRDFVSKPFKKSKHRPAEGIRKQKDGSRSNNNREGGETDSVEEGEAGQNSHLYSETEDVAKSGPSQGPIRRTARCFSCFSCLIGIKPYFMIT